MVDALQPMRLAPQPARPVTPGGPTPQPAVGAALEPAVLVGLLAAERTAPGRGTADGGPVRDEAGAGPGAAEAGPQIGLAEVKAALSAWADRILRPVRPSDAPVDARRRDGEAAPAAKVWLLTGGAVAVLVGLSALCALGFSALATVLLPPR